MINLDSIMTGSYWQILETYTLRLFIIMYEHNIWIDGFSKLKIAVNTMIAHNTNVKINDYCTLI